MQFLCGFIFVTLRWNYTVEWDYYDRMTGISFGYIPLKIREGERMPSIDWVWVSEARIGGGL
jgi:hypothetical protein